MITSGLAKGKKPKATKKAPQKPKEEKEEPQVVEVLTLDMRDEMFCSAYVTLNGNGTRAYMEAFGHTNYQSASELAYRMLRKVEILQRISELTIERMKNAGITKEDWIENMKKLLERCMNGTPVFDLQGNPTGFWKFDTHGAIKVMELMGQHLGLLGNGGGDLPSPAQASEEETKRIAQFISLHTHQNELSKRTGRDSK